MLEEFDKYTSVYDMTDECISLKYNHCYRVMDLSRKYAKMLGFNDGDIELAGIIGLLHDIGRFEQWKVYHTFKDHESVDHAHNSVIELFDKGMIKRFTDRVNDYELIKFAIENHNKIKIEDCDDERKILFAKLIRDVDKLDIMYLLGYLGELDTKGTDEEINPEIVEGIKNRRQISKKMVKNDNDQIAITFGYCFDLNFDIFMEEMKRNVKYFYDRVEYNNKFKEIYEEVNKYIDERIENNVRY